MTEPVRLTEATAHEHLWVFAAIVATNTRLPGMPSTNGQDVIVQEASIVQTCACGAYTNRWLNPPNDESPKMRQMRLLPGIAPADLKRTDR